MQSNLTTLHVISRERVAVAAYYEWLKAGQPAGRDQEFWLRAESQLRQSAAPLAPPANLVWESIPATRPGVAANAGLGTPARPQPQPQSNGRKRRLKSSRPTT